jgi:hypothetical protein
MVQTSVQISDEVHNLLLGLRVSETESLDTVLRRLIQPRSGQLKPSVPKLRNSTQQSYILFGERRIAASAMDALVDILIRLDRTTPNFFARLAPLIQGTSRNHLSQNRLAVYPTKTELNSRVREIVPGWYLGRNISNREKLEFLVKACRVAGIQIGKDLIVNFRFE